MTNKFTVPWKRQGCTNQKYTFELKNDGIEDYVESIVEYEKRGKKQKMTMYIISKSKDSFDSAVKCCGTVFTEYPKLAQ